jgi:hypothetical protein
MAGTKHSLSASTLPIRAKPSADANVVRYLSEDECVVWLREVVGSHPTGRVNRKWVETPEGYVYSPSLQKVRNIPNEPISTLPQSGEDAGMWVEVTVPYVNLTWKIRRPNPEVECRFILPGVFITAKVIWVNKLKRRKTQLLYRVEELYGTYGDIFWADARAFRVITAEEMTPINPEVTDKKIIVDVNAQSLTCYEGNSEVYYCQVATGKKLDELGNPVETWATPVGNFWVWRKLYSLHMSGGSAGATNKVLIRWQFHGPVYSREMAWRFTALSGTMISGHPNRTDA